MTEKHLRTEADLILLCESDLIKEKEKASIVSQQFKTLNCQQEELISNLKGKCNQYHLATTLSETYTLDFDPS
jgi:hypothetical protein